MSLTITIQGTPIEFPSSAQSPNWAPGVIEFALAVEAALSGLAGIFDVPPSVLVIDAYNPTPGPIDLPNMSFPVSQVRSILVNIAVFRSTNSTSVYEEAELVAIYSPDNSIGQKWELTRISVGDGQINFSITDVGQVQFTTTAIAGSAHTGKITYRATAILQS